jgi:hypothetical protein
MYGRGNTVPNFRKVSFLIALTGPTIAMRMNSMGSESAKRIDILIDDWYNPRCETEEFKTIG